MLLTKEISLAGKDTLDVVLEFHEGFDAKDIVKLNTSINLMEQVLNSAEFRDKVLAYRFTSTNGYTSKQIYEMIMSGANTVDPAVDGKIKIKISKYYKGNRVVGYTYPSTEQTWVNSKYFDYYSPAEVVGNLVHEAVGHKIGFDHDHASEASSVPYQIGYIAEELASIIYKGGKLTPLAVVPNIEPDPEKPIPAPIRVMTCKRKVFAWPPFKKVCLYV